MKEHGTLFQLAMVTALLADLKSQTRRAVKLPHANPLGVWEPTTIGGSNGGRTKAGNTIPEQGAIWHTRSGDCIGSPYGQPGDRIWVRETFYAFGRWETRYSPKKKRDEWHFVDLTIEAGFKHLFEQPAQWKRSKRETVTPTWWKRPAIFMPRAASRITLEVTGVRVERLQDISEADAKAEGLKAITKDGRTVKYGIPDADGMPGTDDIGWPWHDWHLDARGAYRRLWEQINGPGSWEANPWAWVIEFKRLEA